jgi:7-carboxy-7-deazaguanine synthase
MKNNKYKLNEIFYSIQGEGRFTGYPAIFIRFAGCNLKCDFCDTDFSEKFTMTAADIFHEVMKYKADRIILTGGEPLLQVDLLLLLMMDATEKKVHVETNGTIIPNEKLDIGLDWITVSPKEKWRLKKGNELKVVYQGQDLAQYEDSKFQFYYLQPCERNGKYNFKETIKVVKESSKWKLSIQTQKLLKIK